MPRRQLFTNWHWLSERAGATPGPGMLLASALFTMFVAALGVRLMGSMGAVGLADYSGLSLIILPALVLVAYLAWLQERVWVYLALAGHLVIFMSASNEGTGAGELLFASIALGGLPFWFVKELIVHRRTIIRTPFDVFFTGIILSTSIVALVANRLHGGDITWYLKELAPFLDLLLYFPLRSVLRTRRDVTQALVIFAALALVTGVMGLVTYKERLAKAVFAWQAASSRVYTNEPLMMSFLIASGAVAAYGRRLWQRLAGTVGIGLGLVFLVVTFSRGAFASGVIGLVIVAILSQRRGARRIALGTTMITAAGIAVVFALFPTVAGTLSKSVSARLSSISRTSTDQSFNLRVIEASTVLGRFVPGSPWIGHGYGTTFSWFDPVEGRSVRHTFIHNGFVRPLFKYGIPLGVFFIMFLVYPLLRAFTLPLRRLDRLDHALMVTTIAYLSAALVNNYVSDMVSHFAGPFNFILAWAILDYLERRLRPTAVTEPLAGPAQLPIAAAGA